MTYFRKSLFALALVTALFSAVAQELSAMPADNGYPRLMQGPMAGAVSEDTIRIWLRTSAPLEVTLLYGTAPEPEAMTTGPTVRTAKQTDYTAVLTVGGLEADTKYYYRVLVEGKPDLYLGAMEPFSISTVPATGSKAPFRLAFGSGARFQRDRVQPIWHAVQNWQPNLFLWIGDNMYGDSHDPDILAEEYQRQRDITLLQPVQRTIPQLAVWDDHDFALNNHDHTNPVKDAALEVFKNYWANPSYGLPETKGVFFRHSWGDVDLFMLDCRYWRDPNRQQDSPGKTFLGAGQLAWLKNGLKESKASFKLLVSGSGWTKAKGEGGDSWASFTHERDSLFAFIRDNDISGVLLLSGDTHCGELNVIPFSQQGGYDLYDLVSSPLGQNASIGWVRRNPEQRIRVPFSSSANCGIIDFHFDGTPRLVFRLIDTGGRVVWKPLVLTADELVNGVSSWRDKQDFPQ